MLLSGFIATRTVLTVLIFLLGIAPVVSVRVQAQQTRRDDPLMEFTASPGVQTPSVVDETIRFGVSLSQLYELAEPCLVEVLWHSGTPGSTDTAFCVDPEGLYMAVNREARKGDRLTLRKGADKIRTEVAAVDSLTGLCLLKAQEEFEDDLIHLRLRREAVLEPGEVVFGFHGFGTGAGEPCVAGRLVGRDSSYFGETLPISHLRIYMNLAGGPVGGPVLDESGAVVGVLTRRKLENPGEYHALPAALIEKMIQDYRAFGDSGPAWLGASFHVQSTTPQIISVREGSPAVEAGLLPGDIILRLGDRRVQRLSDMVDACYLLLPGQGTDVEVIRGLERLTLRCTPVLYSERPSRQSGKTKPDKASDGTPEVSFDETHPHGDLLMDEEPSATVGEPVGN